MLLINKEPGPTSHDIVDRVRKITGEKRVGHAGTLDPFAEGLLIILVGREETKQQASYLGMDKTYEAVIHLGAQSSTDDSMGIITPVDHSVVSEENITRSINSLVGTREQMPPAYSAKKIKGKKAYEIARAGGIPDLKPKIITIHSLKKVSYEWPLLTITCSVSSGTYIRAIARDIGTQLGCGAYVEKLKRTSIGPYLLSNATTLPEKKV